MKRVLTAAITLAASSGVATAGGIERSSQSVGILFEEGSYAEFSFGAVDPSISGVQSVGGINSGDMAKSFTHLSFGYKQELQDNWDLALIVDQPVGADVAYPATPGYAFQGATADVDSLSVTGLLRYSFDENFSFYGGLRAQAEEGTVFIPAFGNYTLTAERETDLGYVVGAAYERPDIALRIALTYNSEIEHTFDSVTEFGSPSAPFDVTMPQSLNLEFQTGIAPDTLLFGSARWVDWTEFDITPVVFTTAVLPGSSIVSYDDDTISYTLGLGRRFNENWSGAVILGYEDGTGGLSANLGPTDGYRSIALAATYSFENIEVTGAIRYVDIGDATTNLQAGGTGDFSGNDAIGVGLKVGYNF